MIYTTPEAQRQRRIHVHPSQRQCHVTPVPEQLHVACMVSNPARYYSRYRLYQAFVKHMYESGVALYTVELALRDRNFEIKKTTETELIQLRSSSELWHKENCLNIAISRFPADWVYGAYWDCDFHCTRPDWAVETIHQLQSYEWVQMFHYYADLMPDWSPSAPHPGFVKVWKDAKAAKAAKAAMVARGMNAAAGVDVMDADVGDDVPLPNIYSGQKDLWGSPGGGWAFRRKAFEATGGLLDTCILGSADYHMAVALAGRANRHPDVRIGTDGYRRSLAAWADLAAALDGKIGYVENFAVHGWHGKRRDRGYVGRPEILRRNQFDPYTDLKYDWQGVLGWVGNKPALEEDVRQYLRSRNEDSIDP